MIVAALFSPLGIVVCLLVFVGGGYLIYLKQKAEAEKKQASVKAVSEGTADWLEANNLMPNVEATFDLVTNNTQITVIPMENADILVILDTYQNKRYVIKKGSIIGFHSEINGERTKIRGGYAFGFGLVKGGVASIDSVREYINLNNVNCPLMTIQVGINVQRNEFDRVGDFVNRLEAVLNLYT